MYDDVTQLTLHFFSLSLFSTFSPLAIFFQTPVKFFRQKVLEADYPPAPSTPPEPAPPDPSLSTAARDPRSNDRRFLLQQGLEGVSGFRRLMKASTMPTAGGSHTSLEDITCKKTPPLFLMFRSLVRGCAIHPFIENSFRLSSVYFFRWFLPYFPLYRT
jgi:hypothetical protein